VSGTQQSNASPDRPARRFEDAVRWVRLAVVVVALVGAFLALALSLVSYERLKEHLDAFTVDRDANVSRVEFDAVVSRLRVLAVGLIGLAATLVAFGRAFDRVASGVARSWAGSIRRAPSGLRAWIVEDGWTYVGALGLAIVAAVAVRVAFLDVPMRYDEATTYNNFVSKPLYVGLAHYPYPNNHLLHTFLAKLSVTAFGTAPWAIRLPALLAGIALVPATFALARVLYGRAAALLAAALVASSSTLVEYSTNARGYTLVALATVVAFIAATHVLEDDSIGAWAVIVVAGALGLYAVPVMLYPLGGALLWLVLSRLVARATLWPFLGRLGICSAAIGALTLLLYAPVFAASGVRSVTSNDYVAPRSWGIFFDSLPGHVHETFETWVRDLPLVFSVALAIGLVASLLLTPFLSRFPVPPLLAVVAWTVPVLVLQRAVPFTRVWLFLVPLALAAVAGFYGWLLGRVPGSRVLAPAAAALIAAGATWAVVDADSVRESRETGGLLDAPAVASFLASHVEPGDRIFAYGSETMLQYYLGRDGIDARPLLYASEPNKRTFLVVNVLGGQTVAQHLRELRRAGGEVGKPRLLRRYPSALVFLVEHRG
jgi:Dolichyl-phosphate-mannose-protein mannosyltransferase